MSDSWKMTVEGSAERIKDALARLDMAEGWDAELVVSAREKEEGKRDWVIEIYSARRPDEADREALRALFEGQPPRIAIEKLPRQDWVTLSQEGVRPIRAGPFHVRTPDYPPDPQAIDFVIPAAQAFGTGQHETTAGCLEMLAAMRRHGVQARHIADIGTGTGLLAMAASALWPATFVTASDIDPVCADVVEDNAKLNQVRLGAGRGELTLVIAPGMEHELLRARGPYDLLIANILAGPLIALAPSFAEAVAPGGHVVLAGLLAGEQEAAVRRAYRRVGFRLAGTLERGEWAILWLRRRSYRGYGR